MDTVLTAVSLFVAFIVAANALKCRSDDEDSSNDEFENAAKMCMNNLSNWDRSSRDDNRGSGTYRDSSGGGYYDSHYNDEENSRDDQQNYRNNKGRERQRYGRDNRSKYNRNTGINYKNTSTSSSETSSALENIEPCIVHCIFRLMHMLDDNSVPERSAVSRTMTKGIRDSKVRDFIEDAVDECFDMMEREQRRGKCQYSKGLALCLEEKGRQTCEDWDESNDGSSSNNDRSNDNQKRDRDNGYQNNDSK